MLDFWNKFHPIKKKKNPITHAARRVTHICIGGDRHGNGTYWGWFTPGDRINARTQDKILKIQHHVLQESNVHVHVEIHNRNLKTWR